ncbi:MAG: hypothetical protein ACJ8F7_08040 [Gemmataceae bacterium]
MPNLTDELRRSVEAAGGAPLRLTDPATCQEYVLIRADLFDRLTEADYDASPWTAEERDALAVEAGKQAGWDEMNEYDNYPDKP